MGSRPHPSRATGPGPPAAKIRSETGKEPIRGCTNYPFGQGLLRPICTKKRLLTHWVSSLFGRAGGKSQRLTAQLTASGAQGLAQFTQLGLGIGGGRGGGFGGVLAQGAQAAG